MLSFASGSYLSPGAAFPVSRHANFTYDLVISEPTSDYQGLTGLLDADLIRRQIGEVKAKTFYCASSGDVRFLYTGNKKTGCPAAPHPSGNIRYSAQVYLDQAWPRK
jgi:hypothetical protein